MAEMTGLAPSAPRPDAMNPTLRKLVMRRVPARLIPILKSLQLRRTLIVGALLRRLPGSSLRFGPPRQFCATLAKYVSTRPAQTRASYVELRPPINLARTPPRSIDGTVHRGFIVEMNRISPAEGVAAIADGRVLTSTGQIIAPRDCLISEVSSSFLSSRPSGNDIFLRFKLPTVTRVDGDVAVLTSYYSNFYFHWLLDTLPRFRMLQESGYRWDKIVVPKQTRFQRESLELLGVGSENLITEAGRHIEAATLVVPTMPGLSGNPPRWVCDFLRESFLPHLGNAPPRSRKIYISRQKDGTRKVTNETELLDILRGDEFEVLFLEELSFLEQVRAFAEASIVVSPHGAGLSNLVFCGPGTSLLELFSPHYVNVCYWALSNQLRLNYSYLIGEPTHPDLDPEIPLVRENIVLDLGKVRAALKAIG
jgi:capsular polysaccharide biosynthesis protein